MADRKQIKREWLDSLARMRPSEVFAMRLKETRRARDMTQAELAYRLTERGVPMSKGALLRIEKGERGLSLDEALALTAALNAVPAYMLTPPEGAWVQLDDNIATDGAGLREFLRYGFPWNPDPVPDEAHDEVQREKFQLNLARHALALVDAVRSKDKAGITDAGKAIVAEVKRREAERERGESDA